MNGTSGESRQITRRDHNMGGRAAPVLLRVMLRVLLRVMLRVMLIMMQCREYPADRTLAGVF
ncbi:MAG: hypothetical protein ACI9AO_000789, partial [Ilumatobacter sp.]